MKKLLVTLAAVLVSASAFAQGTVAFVNRTSQGDWKVSLPGNAGPGGTAGIVADLFLADASGINPTGTSLGQTTFRTTPAAAQFFLTENDLTVANVAPANTTAKFVAVFTGANLANGSVNQIPLQFATGSAAGGGTPPLPPGELVPQSSALLGGTFTLTVVPEPSTIALGFLGAAALLLRRRK